MENNEIQLKTGPYKTTYVGTEVIRKSTRTEWINYGEILKRVDEAKQWAIGDWLVDGKRHYGDGLYQEAEKILGIDHRTLEGLKQISEKFKITLRNVNLTWSHHKEVASVKKTVEDFKGRLAISNDPDNEKIQEFLEKAENEKLSVRALRDIVTTWKRRQQEAIRLANEPEKFSIILADPAWEYDFSRSDSRLIDNQYLPSSLSDMKKLKLPAADDCVLFMWATSPKLEQAFELINAWGFEYKTCMIWVKDKIGMGYYARQKHELLLISTTGKLQLPDEDKRPDSVFFADRTEHSEKPEIVYELIETMYPEYKKLEMFSRGKRDGWSSWGDEA